MIGNDRSAVAGLIAGRLPAVVDAYDATKRTCRVSIHGLTTGAEELPEAQIEYPIGDRSKKTEIEILKGDAVWVSFMGGDPRYPIITGWRNSEVGNVVDLRYWHHKDITLHADGDLLLKASTLTIEADQVKINSSSLTHNGTNIGDTHAHSGVMGGLSNTGSPV